MEAGHFLGMEKSQSLGGSPELPLEPTGLHKLISNWPYNVLSSLLEGHDLNLKHEGLSSYLAEEYTGWLLGGVCLWGL